MVEVALHGSLVLITGWNWLELVITGWIERLGLSFFGGSGRGVMKKCWVGLPRMGSVGFGLAAEQLGSEEFEHGLAARRRASAR